ncbi:MAG: hypothetical protein JRH20_13215 [Deltaproteobacteria bacterium]|nr:hypothetical protein [Deltaproteobacteria bacterium]
MKTQILSIFTTAMISLVAACGGEVESVDEYVVLGKADNGAPAAVQLVYADSWTHSKYGMSSKERNFVVRVQNIAYHKDVVIHVETASGEWVDIAATYVSGAAGNTELWKARVQSDGYGRKFVVKYTVKGVTYWDNNNGRDYEMGDADGPMLGVGVNVRMNQAFFTNYNSSARSLRGTIDVRNLGYSKKVRVHYSTDGWQTEQTTDARYLGYMRIYGYSGVQNPNVHGIEGWTFETYVSGDKVDYYVTYEVDGQTHRDNNYGANYTLTN